MGKVWDAQLAPNHKLVLLAYADAAEHDGTKCYPGEDRIVEMTGYSRSQVRRVTSELIQAGYLTKVRGGHRGLRAEYRVEVAKLEGSQIATLSETEESQPRDPIEGERVANDTRKGRAHATPPVLTRPDLPTSSSSVGNAGSADRSRQGGGGIDEAVTQDPEAFDAVVRWCHRIGVPLHERTLRAWLPQARAFIDAGGQPTDGFLEEAQRLRIRMPAGWLRVPGAIPPTIWTPPDCDRCGNRSVLAYTRSGALVPVDHPEAGDETDLCPECHPLAQETAS